MLLHHEAVSANSNVRRFVAHTSAALYNYGLKPDVLLNEQFRFADAPCLPMAQTSSILKDWAFKEMDYGGGWPDEKMVALCSGPMEEVWQWIVTHCKEREKVRMIRGNLALAARTRTGGIGKDKDLSVGTTGNYIADNSR